MLSILAQRTYRHLFAAQLLSLLGTGLMTVALGLLAYDLAGEDAGAVLGTALAIKMVAYVGVAPVAQAFADRVPRRTMLVGLDLVRAAAALALPLVTEVWQIYVLIFALQAASAGFTPTFQATLPDVLPDEADYTRALSLSRLAYEVENLSSPMLAAALLTVVGYHDLFAGTVLGFLASAALVLSVTLPAAARGPRRGIWARTTRGLRIYLATPRLRGLLAVALAIASASAMVLVNTVVIVQGAPAHGGMGMGETAVAWALAAFGGGSMLAAMALPRLLERLHDRPVVLGGAAILVLATGAGTLVGGSYALLLALWMALGVGYSMAQTPAGRLLRRSAHPEDRPAVFAAQFALSHACWLVCYPLAGWFGAGQEMQASFLLMAAIGLAGVVLALGLWPAEDPGEIAHDHPDLPPDHPHLREHAATGRHRHPFIVDDLHTRWGNP
ncbi:MAG: MFS transporter [Pseudomonadota bacterium]